jgi:hypothetical protein
VKGGKALPEGQNHAQPVGIVIPQSDDLDVLQDIGDKETVSIRIKSWKNES